MKIPLEEEPLDISELADDAAITEVVPSRTAKSATAECPHCGAEIAARAKRCSACRRYVDEEFDDEFDEDGPDYVPCPKCDSQRSERVLWTIWGSFYFTALFSHVRCLECGHKYNGRTGGSNMIVATICVCVPAILIAGIVGYTVWLIGDRQAWW